jgi:hypothetical protein
VFQLRNAQLWSVYSDGKPARARRSRVQYAHELFPALAWRSPRFQLQWEDSDEPTNSAALQLDPDTAIIYNTIGSHKHQKILRTNHRGTFRNQTFPVILGFYV